MSDNIEKTIQLLKDIREGKTSPSEKPLELQNADFTGENLEGIDFSFINLSGAIFDRCNLSGANFFKATLHKVSFKEANLQNAEFTASELNKADFEKADASNAGFGASIMKEVSCFQANFSNTTLSKTIMTNSDFRMVNFSGARFLGAQMDKCDFTKANFQNAELSDSNLNKSVFRDVDLRGANLKLIKNYTSCDWYGVDFRNTNFLGAYLFKRYVVDYNYLEEFKRQSKVHAFVYFLWWVTSDCGRSVTRWFAWIIAFILLFTYFYTLVPIDYGSHQTWLSPFYFSVVTFTTLGFGDVLPMNTTGQILVIVEVLLGYAMLGGALSIFANKFARRG